MKVIRLALLTSLFLVPARGLSAQAVASGTGVQTTHQFSKQVTQDLSAGYLLFLPQGYDADAGRKWPLIYFLHGAGERGQDLELVKKHGPPKIVE